MIEICFGKILVNIKRRGSIKKFRPFAWDLVGMKAPKAEML